MAVHQQRVAGVHDGRGVRAGHAAAPEVPDARGARAHVRALQQGCLLNDAAQTKNSLTYNNAVGIETLSGATMRRNPASQNPLMRRVRAAAAPRAAWRLAAPRC